MPCGRQNLQRGAAVRTPFTCCCCCWVENKKSCWILQLRQTNGQMDDGPATKHSAEKQIQNLPEPIYFLFHNRTEPWGELRAGGWGGQRWGVYGCVSKKRASVCVCSCEYRCRGWKEVKHLRISTCQLSPRVSFCQQTFFRHILPFHVSKLPASSGNPLPLSKSRRLFELAHLDQGQLITQSRLWFGSSPPPPKDLHILRSLPTDSWQEAACLYPSRNFRTTEAQNETIGLLYALRSAAERVCTHLLPSQLVR